jgi:8-oxo-dGTP diphosphatase
VVRLIGVYSTPGRDPRGAFVSLAFHATIAGGALRVTEEARAHRWLEAGEELPLGFDHGRIVADLRAQQG